MTQAESGETQTARIWIERRADPESDAYWQRFDVPYTPGTGANLTSLLRAIAREPVTVDGERTSPVAYDAACLEEVCGSCTMRVNGMVRQGCSTLVEDVIAGSGELTLQPMAKFPVRRDLCVDRSRLFEDLKRVRAWVPIDGLHDLGPGPRESPENQAVRYEMSRCMSCGCCLDACPQFTQDNDFVGAAVIGQVRYFNRHETGAREAEHRLDVMMEPGGVADCGNAQNCVKVCPKDIPLTEAIAEIGRETTKHAVRKFFKG